MMSDAFCAAAAATTEKEETKNMISYSIMKG